MVRRRRRHSGRRRRCKPPNDARPAVASLLRQRYFSGFDAEDLEQYVRPHVGVACFPTHDGLTTLVTVWPVSRPGDPHRIEGSVRKAHASTTRRWPIGCELSELAGHLREQVHARVAFVPGSPSYCGKP